MRFAFPGLEHRPREARLVAVQRGPHERIAYPRFVRIPADGSGPPDAAIVLDHIDDAIVSQIRGPTIARSCQYVVQLQGLGESRSHLREQSLFGFGAFQLRDVTKATKEISCR